MKKTFFKKPILLLCALLAGVVCAHAEDFDYEWVKITDLSQVADDDVVLLVDKSNGLALSYSETYDLRGVEIAVGDGNTSVIENVAANMMWTIANLSNNSFKLINNGGYLWGSMTAYNVGVSNSPSGTTDFALENYGDAGGKLYYVGNNGYAYFSWSQNEDNLISIDNNTNDRFTLYKKGNKVNYVKWKKVDFNQISDGDVVAIVDLTTAKAMSNDKADKEPDAVDVSLNYDKDRITGEVPAKIQWTYTSTGSGFKLSTSGNYLYADSEGLKVGSSDASNVFSINTIDEVGYLGMTISGKDYLAGAESSMFSNIWKWMETTEGKPDDAVKNTRLAFYKKVSDPKKIVTIKLPEYYNVDKSANTLDLKTKATITGASFSNVSWESSNTEVATVSNGVVTLNKRGSVVIVARVGNDYYDNASAGCTVVIDDLNSSTLGSKNNPLTVAQAKDLAEGKTVEGVTLEAGVNYYIKGKVSKVNSGMMAMFGDMDFGALMGDTGGNSGMNLDEMMDDMDFDMDPEAMSEMGFDMPDFSSMGFDMSAFFGSSDKVSYYISDDGMKDSQLKVINGHGTIKSQADGVMEFNVPDLSPGDCVVVCGPLVYTEDTNMFSSMMGNNNSEPKYSAKVDEQNYLYNFDQTLLIKKPEAPKEVHDIYVGKTLDCGEGGMDGANIYEIDNLWGDQVLKITSGMGLETTFKSSDEEIAKWDESSKKIVGVNEGKATITVKVKVVVQEANDQANPKVEEKSYTMKRKFKLIVMTRDLDPAGYYDGDYVLTTSTNDLLEGTRLILVGTRVKDNKGTDYVMGENNAMMGSGKNGSKIGSDKFDGNKIPCENAPKGTLEVVLEKADENGSWYLNVGRDENDTPLYLYASVKKEEESTNNQNQPSGGNNNEDPSQQSTGTGGFNMDEMMEMFNPSSGLKVGTVEGTKSKVEGVDSLKATITIDSNTNIATIKFLAVPDTKNNTIMLSSSFDMESMMNMFSSTGEGTGEGQGGGQGQGSSSSSFDMSSFDMFMASFNTKKSDDEQPAETGKDPKNFMPRIYRFVPDESFDISIGSTEYKTIVTYKDVKVDDNDKDKVGAYIVTGVQNDQANMVRVTKLKGGEPYLLKAPEGSYKLTLLPPNGPDDFSALSNNQLKKSDRKTSGERGTSTIYVLANRTTHGVGFYQWTGGDLGSGRVYLPVPATTETVREFVAFGEESTAIQNIESTESHTGIFYDLQGRRVNNPTNGIYIVNGKKAIIK